MKLVLFLLVASTCALVSLSNPVSFDPSSNQEIDFQLSPQSRANLVDSFRGFISNIIDTAVKLIQDYGSKGTNIVSSVESQIKGLSTLAGSAMDKITDEFKALTQAWENQTQIASNCTEKYFPLIGESINNTKQEVQLCLQNSTAAVEEIKAAVEPNIEEIRNYIKILQGLVDDCFKNSTNVFKGIACVFGKGTEIQSNIGEIVTNVQDILTIASSQSVDLVRNTGKCLNTAVDNYELEVLKLEIEYKNCVLDGFW